MIVLFGATGYTGALTAEAMVARGLAPVLAGRDPERLAQLASRLGGLPTAHADVDDRTSVFNLVGRGDVLVSTVGPFRRWGWPAVRGAVEAGAIYLDSTGEPPFLRKVHEWFDQHAQDTGAALLPAFGHDYVPGVLAGALALREAGDAARRVDVGYFLTGARGQVFSRGTAQSIIGVALERGYAWRDGALRSEPTASRLRTFIVDGRPRPAVTIGASEHWALPRLAPGLTSVDVHLGWFGPASGALHATVGLTSAIGRVRGSRRLLTTLGDLAIRRLPAAPSSQALAGVLLARTRLDAPEPYALTAGLLAWGAGRAAEHGVNGTGALDAVTAFGLDELVAGAASAGLRQRDASAAVFAPPPGHLAPPATPSHPL